MAITQSAFVRGLRKTLLRPRRRLARDTAVPAARLYFEGCARKSCSALAARPRATALCLRLVFTSRAAQDIVPPSPPARARQRVPAARLYFEGCARHCSALAAGPRATARARGSSLLRGLRKTLLRPRRWPARDSACPRLTLARRLLLLILLHLCLKRSAT